MASVSASLYYFASFIHLAIIPKHLKVGSNLIRPTVSNIPTTESTALPKAILPATWDYVNGLLMIMCRYIPLLVFGNMEADFYLSVCFAPLSPSKSQMGAKWLRPGY